MSELIIRTFIFLAIATAVPFAAGLAFASSAFFAVIAVFVRRAGKCVVENKTSIDSTKTGFVSEFASGKDDIADCEDRLVAACEAKIPGEVPLLYENSREKTSVTAKSQVSDVMRLIGKTEDAARLNAVKRAIADAGKRSAAPTAKKRDYPV